MGNSAARITPQQASALADWMVVDVRSATERAAQAVPGSLHMPLERVESLAQEQQFAPGQGRRFALLCKAGTRATLAQERLARCGVEAAVIEGGMDRWAREGLPVVCSTGTGWSLERQVRLGAGLLVLLAVAGTVLLGRGWLLLAGFVGAGLTFAGATDICMMGNVLARMPWNRVRSAR